jgi:hypothetical protein
LNFCRALVKTKFNPERKAKTKHKCNITSKEMASIYICRIGAIHESPLRLARLVLFRFEDNAAVSQFQALAEISENIDASAKPG